VGDLKECCRAGWKTAWEQTKPQWAQALRTVLQRAKADLMRADLTLGQRLGAQTMQRAPRERQEQEQEQMQRKERAQGPGKQEKETTYSQCCWCSTC
jgi:hypothetical protein